jgi:hypothetical protein
MTEQERTALAALRLSWVQAPDDVWRRSPFHVDGLHEAVAQDVRAGIVEAEESADASPPGLVLEGRWAGRSAATCRTGSPGTPTGSRRS